MKFCDNLRCNQHVEVTSDTKFLLINDRKNLVARHKCDNGVWLCCVCRTAVLISRYGKQG